MPDPGLTLLPDIAALRQGRRARRRRPVPGRRLALPLKPLHTPLFALFFAPLLALLVVVWPTCVHAEPLQPVPPLNARVIDQSSALNAEERSALEQKLATFEAERGSQIVVLLLPTTAPEDIAAFAFRAAETWKIGRRDVGDGVLLVIATTDRRIRIEVARALEGAIPDLAAWRIIDDVIAPAFRHGGYAAGIDAGVDALFALIRGEALPLPEPRLDDAPSSALEDIGALLVVIVPMLGAVLVSNFGRKLGALLTGGATGLIVHVLTASVLLALVGTVLAVVLVFVLGVGASGRGGPPHAGGGPVIRSRGGFGGGGFSGGGGFRSGGGGSFGGGGASGRW